MRKRYFHETLSLLWWVLAAAGVAALNLWIIVANYAACLQSFQLLNFETKRLADDELFGPLFRMVAPEATIAHLLAGAFEAVVAVGLWYAAHLALQIFEQLKDRSEYARLGDAGSLQIITRRIWFTVAELAMLCVPLYFTLATVVQLFRYRVLAQIQGLEDPVLAVARIPAWDLARQKHGMLYAWSFADRGVWGMLAMTAVASLCFELLWRRAEEAGTRLFAPLEQEPVTDPQGTQSGDETPEPPVQPEQGEEEPAEEDPKPDVERREVIGGTAGERVTLDQARANPGRYWIDPETKEIWDSAYRDRLFGNVEAETAGSRSR